MCILGACPMVYCWVYRCVSRMGGLHLVKSLLGNDSLSPKSTETIGFGTSLWSPPFRQKLLTLSRIFHFFFGPKLLEKSPHHHPTTTESSFYKKSGRLLLTWQDVPVGVWYPGGDQTHRPKLSNKKSKKNQWRPEQEMGGRLKEKSIGNLILHICFCLSL